MNKIFTLLIVVLFSFNGLQAQNDCATAVAITSVPFSSGVQTTCGTGNDYIVGSYYTGNYGAGEDYVYSIDITNAPTSLKFTMGGAATWKIMSVHSACPPSSANSLGGISGSGTSGTTTLNFPTNGTYYIFIDTWPTPNCGEFTLNVTLPPVAPECATLTAPANASAVTSINPTLSWTPSATGAAPTAYKVYLGTVNPPTVLTTTITAPATSYTPTTSLSYSTTYYWFVTPTNAGSDTLGCNATVFSFTTPAPPPAPANDDCANAVELTVNPTLLCDVVTSGTTISATQSTETTPTCGETGVNDDVWFKFTATSTAHRITIKNIVGSTADMAMSLYSGNCGSLIPVQCSDPEVMNLSGLTVGTEYKVRVWTYTSTAATRASFDICVSTFPAAPANDECATAVALTVNGTETCTNSVNGTTASATPSTATAATCSATGANDDVWYSFIATATTHLVNVAYTDNATATQVYSGPCGALVALSCFSGAYGNSNLLLSNLLVGDTYYVRVYSTSSTNGTSSDFAICITTPTVPSNDTCATAIAIACGATITNNNALATDDTLPTSTCGSTGTTASYKGVWYTVTAVANGPLTISACGSTFDAYLRVYTGDCSTLTCVGNTSGIGYADAGCTGITNSPTVTFNATTGTTYSILLSSYSVGQFGNYTITTTCTPELGVGEVTLDKKLTIAPNPFTDRITLSDVKDIVSISIIDLSGRLVKTVKPATEIDLGDLRSGMYLINLKMNDGSLQTIKSIKR